MTVPELRDRMKGWLASEYKGVIFVTGKEAVAYALFRETATEVYLRQFFVRPDLRRQGIGREAISTLKNGIWPSHKRLTLDVLVSNVAGIAFWRSAGYKDYCLTLEIMPPEG